MVTPAVPRDLARTMLPLDTFFRITNYSPMLGAQVYLPELQPALACSDPVYQYTWQANAGGRPGRAEISQAIAQAEEMIEQALGYAPVPKWYADEIKVPDSSYPGPYGGLWYRGVGYGIGYPYSLKLRTTWKEIIEGGIEAWSLIDAGAAIAYSDEDGDGYDELAKVTLATSVTDPDEIAVYYPGAGHDYAWEVRPISVSITSGVATITFARHLAVLPGLLEALNSEGVDGTNDANFLEEVAVYRHYNAPSQMAIAEWSSAICDNNQCLVSADTGCIAALDPRAGIVGVHAATWDADEEEWTHSCPSWWTTPARVRLYYRAGKRDQALARPMNVMAPNLARAVTFLALSYMDREWGQCEQLRNLCDTWKIDLALSQSSPSGGTSYKFPSSMLENPFGTTRAAAYAWRVVQPLMSGDAVLSR